MENINVAEMLEIALPEGEQVSEEMLEEFNNGGEEDE
jgi:hypothetical protein